MKELVEVKALVEELERWIISPIERNSMTTIQMQFERLYTGIQTAIANVAKLERVISANEAIETKQALVIRRQEAFIQKLETQIRENEQDLLLEEQLMVDLEKRGSIVSSTQFTIKSSSIYGSLSSEKFESIFDCFCELSGAESEKYKHLLATGCNLILSANEGNVFCLLANQKTSKLLHFSTDPKLELSIDADEQLEQDLFLAFYGQQITINLIQVRCKRLFCDVPEGSELIVHHLCSRIYLQRSCNIKGAVQEIVEVI